MTRTALFAGLLFAGVLVWELLAAGLLWRAWNAMRRGAPGTTAANTVSTLPQSTGGRLATTATAVSAARTASGCEVTITSMPPSSRATCITACDTERRLPMP